jgi:protein-tyrosine-phosphatase
MSTAPTVVFVCEHGAAKSVIAAAYLARLAEAAGLEVRARARGTDPEPVLLPAAVAGLRVAGVTVPHDEPQRPTAAELSSAAMVVSFGPSLDDLVPASVPCLYWRGVPAVSDGFDAARDAIVTRVLSLLAGLADDGAATGDPTGD